MIEQSQSIAKLAEALGKAQAVMVGAVRDRKNPHFKSSYATLESAIEAARGPLTEHGLSWVQMPGPLTEGGINVTTQIMHASGEWVRSSFTMPVVKRDPQAVGSAITYACRYAFMAALGLPPVDDDGEAAMDRDEKPRAKAAPPRPAPSSDFPGDQPSKHDAVAATFVAALRMVQDLTSLAEWQSDNLAAIKALPEASRAIIREAMAEHRAMLTPADEREAA